MKKFTKILTAAAVLLSTLLITGCGATETIKELIDSTHKKWYKYSGETIEIPVGTDDSETANSPGSLKNAEIYVYYDHGLTVAVQSASKQEVELWNGLINKTEEVVIGGPKTYTEEEFNSVKWTGLLAAANFKQQDNPPKIYADKDNCVIIGGDAVPNYKIQWKKFLKEKLIDTLLGE